MTTILYLKNDDVMQPAPYPIVIGERTGIVVSGLGPDDGSTLVGYGPLGEFTITVLRSDATPENVVGLAPTFSDGKSLFQWSFAVREAVVR